VTMTRPRILIVAGQLGLGGAERELVTFLEGGAPQKADIHVVSLAPGGVFRPRIEELLGRKVLSPPRSGRVRRTIWMRQAIAQVNPDLIHSWNLFPIFYLWLTWARRHCPVVGFLQQTPDQARHPWLFHFLAGRTDALVSNSRAALEETARTGVRKAHSVVVHNAVSERFFHATPSAEALRLKGNSTIAVALGRLIPRKRTEWMIRAIAGISTVKLWLIGDGPERPVLERLAEDLGVRSRVEFWGTVHEPAPLLAAADVFVHCAWAEGLPNAVQEAMATGLPVVVPRVSGLPEIIEDGEEGFLFERDDFEKFRSIFSRLVEDSKLRETVGKKARKRSEREFVPEVMTDAILGFYREILKSA